MALTKKKKIIIGSVVIVVLVLVVIVSVLASRKETYNDSIAVGKAVNKDRAQRARLFQQRK